MGSIEPPSVKLVQEPIAIVGSSCRFPGGACSPSQLWELLKEPRDIVQEIPPSRFDTKAFHHQNSQHHGSTNTKHAYLLQEDPRVFDRDFFNISPKEAEAMDPQQRCLLETVYEGVESAGYSIPQLRGSSTGVFVGAMSFDYQLVAMRGLDSLPQYHATGGSMAILANRISYFYDWKGPSLACDTACSSSLVALHQAVLSLRGGEVNMAVAAGANLILGPEPFIAYSKLNMLSPNGRSWMWDSSADGYTRGEGLATVVLKTLSQAIADGDHIECIIREIGVNSDGRTPGITMPSAEAQTRLIRDTYARCGLDAASARDRPQYFEAHGTGTPAGDPIEAQAIHNAFFPGHAAMQDDPLMVGSIKTVLGHTEGTAGLAGVLKASLAVQHGQIPGNLHFRDLNPKIRPFYDHLRVPTTLTPWPPLARNEPRRASVNSFGFGGTNAHVIIESWGGIHESYASKSLTGGLFVLAANSSQGLAEKASALAQYLRKNPETDLGRLSHTLFQRTDFLFRAAFSATTVAQLVDKLDARAEALNKAQRIAAIPDCLPPRILGVFTGQGAQWATMGSRLYEASTVFRSSLDRLQHSLNALPVGDRPDWSLIGELSASKETSRLGEAVVSQPVCTALQVALVDVLHAAGIEFAAVVGHSSGEIAAAYAAGYLSAQDSIRIAFYRGLHSSLAQGPGGKRGKMMAVGMGWEQASAFCSEFGSALKVAASNSLTSCTLSGDAEVIDEAKERLDESKTFARVLAVDTAYHSHHMQPCAATYLESLRNCGVRPLKGQKKCAWYSSVWGANGRSRSLDDDREMELLKGQYWVDNLTNTVQFSQAVNRAISEEQYVLDFALEVGPHPALKGPSTEVIKSLTGVTLPYGGTLKRGDGAVEAFADALGLIWTSFPMAHPAINFEAMCRAFPPASPKSPTVLKDLPTYPWDHHSLIWRESRTSHNFRTHSQRPHELLGLPVALGEHRRREVHWRQVFRLSELPWVRGHAIQGEVLFPATGYLTMAYEAAVRLVEDPQTLHLVELHDFEMVRAMSLQEDSPGLEVVFTISVTSQTDNCITARVACYSSEVNTTMLDGPLAGLVNHFNGAVRLFLGAPQSNALPRRTKPLLPMSTLDMDQFYASLSKVGYTYSDLFRASSVDRHLNQAVVAVSVAPELSSMRASMHPVTLDTAIQGLLAGYSYPEDGRLGVVYLPTGVDCVRINMAPTAPGPLVADSFLTSADARSLTGDVDVFNAANATVDVQLRGVHWTALNQNDDRWLYAAETWRRDPSSGIEPMAKTTLSAETENLRKLLVRTAYYYLRRLRDQIKPSELLLMGNHRRHMMKWVREHLFPQIEAGMHPDIQTEWSNDTLADVEQWSASYLESGNIDMRLLHAVGTNLAAIVRGTMPSLQVLLKDGMLDRLYVEGVGFADGNLDIKPLVRQIAHRYPCMKVVEVGAGTGGTTQAVLSALGDKYKSYAYTDVSAGFFEPAKAKFSQHNGKMMFKMLNIEKDPVDQGFEEGSYDMVVASNCLHATRGLKDTVQHCRRLLRPGGFLVLLEITRDHLPIQLIMGTLPGWFLGAEEGRTWAPTIGLDEWDSLLKATGFSGVSTSSTPSFCSVIMSQATDDAVQMLREPLSPGGLPPPHGQVLVVGKSEVASKSHALLASAGAVIEHDLETADVSSGAAVLCLCDLERPVFGGMTEARFKALQALFCNASTVLWVTSGATSGQNPLSNVAVGLGRTLLAERPDLRLQLLDVDVPASVEPSMLASLLLQLVWMDAASISEDILWTCEPHLRLKDDALYIPRVLAEDDINRRCAARTRAVTQLTSLKRLDTVVEVAERPDALELLSHHVGSAKTGELRVQVAASSLRPLVDDGSTMPAFRKPSCLCIGHDLTSGDKVICLSHTNSSIISVTEDQILFRWCASPSAEEDSDADQLQLLTARILAESLLRDIKGPSWVHDAPHDISQAISRIAERQGLVVFQTTSDMASAHDRDFIHPYISKRDVHLLPRGVETFINLKPSRNQGLSALLRASLSHTTLAIDLEELTVGLGRDELCSLAREHHNSEIKSTNHRDQILPIGDVSTETAKGLGPAAIIDWSAAEKVSTLVRPVDYKGLFGSDKTYLLFGMTGDVGISVARWMVDFGARNIVLASRSTGVPADVVKFMSQNGVTMRVMAVDITNREALHAAYDEIKSCMPPVKGVINGAMVLRDRIFADTPWADFEAVLAPKVAGTRNLDEIFGEGGEALDFFVVLSSATSMVGIIGQSAYSAANHYAASLMRQRRGRGLPGSVVVIGFLTGLGYIFRRSDKEHLKTIEKSLLPRLNRQTEMDLHEMLAEAIVCGRPDSGLPVELITGVRTSFQDAWHEDPRLSCYLVEEGVNALSTVPEESNGNIKVEAQLAAVEEPTECAAVLEKCFAWALGNMLQLDPDQIAGDVPAASLGVDSLVSVRIREWFLKELGVDVPVLKIMSTNHTLSRLCEDALAGWRKRQTGGSQAVVSSATHQEPEMDWAKEIAGLIDAIPSLIPPGADSVKDTPRRSARRVVLTGGTGFLGTHMLHNLVADADIAEVHCLCIRSRHVRVQDARIREYKGDLTRPLLGLSTGDFIRLTQTADMIIHLGAEVNHLKSYEAVRTANVVSTQVLLAMATPRGIPVHFVSSSSVAMLQKDRHELPEIPPSQISPPTDAESLMKNAIGYAASKWVGEMLLERAAPPAVVHRFPNIMGPDAPDEIPLVALDRFCTKMRAVPALDPQQWVGQLDIIDVGDVVPDFMANAYGHNESFAVRNYCSSNEYWLSDLRGMYEEKFGCGIEVLPTAEWMRRATAMGMPKGVEATFTGHDEVFVSPVLRKGLR